MGVAGLAVLGLGRSIHHTSYGFSAQDMAVNSVEMLKAIEVLTGFSLGAESIALFARVGGRYLYKSS
jgi:K(+)-stimulated pyrophosphate-energized sodium pump